MIRQSSPRIVDSPSFVPQLIVTHSRRTVRAPTFTKVRLPSWNLRSCVLPPMWANGKTWHCGPSVVAPSMTAWAWISHPSPISASGPTTA